ncbi:MAG: GntR family transcriptional regulator [Syntrophorhabdales bacterium]|jgi:DNA-binding GntR family transcriptional regulator
MDTKGKSSEEALSGRRPGHAVTHRKKELTSTKVYRELRIMIGANRFKPGLRLNVEELRKELGFSRTSVWEAIRRLEQDGIVWNIPHRGVFMAENPLERVRDLIGVRGALDRLAGQLAVGRTSSRIIDQLSRCLPDQLRAIERADVGGYVAADVRFHVLICEASGNAYLRDLYESITMHVFPSPFDYLPCLSPAYLAHQEVVAGLSDRDPDRVDNAMVRHTEIAMSHLKEQMRAQVERGEMVRNIRENSSLPGPRKKCRKLEESSDR